MKEKQNLGKDGKEQKQRKINVYEHAKYCPTCGEKMQYVYGEKFQCTNCGTTALSDFGMVKEFLNERGPQPAIVISDHTGVSVEYINKMLREGRIEIPDGSEVYIRCQRCGTDIRYGRFCPECMLTMTKGIGNALWMPEVGERPTMKAGQTGKMHTLERPIKKR